MESWNTSEWKGYSWEEQCWIPAHDILDPIFSPSWFHIRHLESPGPRPWSRPRRNTAHLNTITTTQYIRTPFLHSLCKVKFSVSLPELAKPWFLCIAILFFLLCSAPFFFFFIILDFVLMLMFADHLTFCLFFGPHFFFFFLFLIFWMCLPVLVIKLLTTFASAFTSLLWHTIHCATMILMWNRN